MDWSRGWLGLRAMLVLPVVVAVLSFVTGVANLTVAPAPGPVADLLPTWVERTVGFTGTLTGFLLLASVYGLRRRYRVAWYSTIVLLPLSALQGVLHGVIAVPGVGDVPTGLPLVVLSILAIPATVVNRGLFDRRIELSPAQQAAIAALVGAQVYITMGTYALREDFTGVSTLLDAFYFGVVTASTVGFGDVAAVPTSQSARLFTVTVVLVGTSAFALAIGSVLGPAIESRLSKALGTMTESQLELLEDHVLVLGYGDLTEPIIEELDSVTDFVVVTNDAASASALAQRDIPVLTADPSDEEPLERAGIDRARAVLVATNDDAQDALAILTARELNPEIRIVAAATERENERKLRRAGADQVISPAVIGGHMLVDSAMDDADIEGTADELADHS